ncbi:unnamed protein product [Caenorhabditis bovis]|uniref:Cytochrome P450 n=1 Tax=Caenorhabditis bovis TaxID=2654633 RepID=A0A8S1EH33_9PELO|nr:unnamed protein product [Caenorhabditis bovis]
MFVLLATLFIVSYILYFYWKVSQYPKGPTPLPFIGNLHQFPKANFHIFIDELSRKYGPCFTIWMPRPIVVLADYDHIKDAFITQPDKFIYRVQTPPETLLQPKTNVGVLMAHGDVWRVQRRTSLKILRDFGMGRQIMEEQIMRSVHEMIKHVDSIPDKSAADLFWPIQLCVGNVINESLFGYHYSHNNIEKFKQFVTIVDTHLRLSNKSVLMLSTFPWMKHLPIMSGFYNKIKNNITSYQSFIEEEVDKEAKKYDPENEPENFVQAYLHLAEYNKEELDMTNLYANVLDFWLAGMETTSNSLRWHILYMMKFPEIQDKVREEIHSVVGTSGYPSMTDKPNLPYTQAVIHEVQRHSNMIPFLGSHVCQEKTFVKGKHFPSGTWVFAQIWSVMRNDPIFENPTDFQPNRYLLEDGKTFNREILERTIPFSVGKRSCVGEGLARMELFLIFATLIQKYKFEAIDEIDLNPNCGAVLTSKPYKCKLTVLDRS